MPITHPNPRTNGHMSADRRVDFSLSLGMLRRFVRGTLMFAACTLAGLAPSYASAAPNASPSAASLQAQVASGALQHAVTHSRALPWTNRTLYTLKAVDKATQQPKGWTWDDTGTVLADGGAALRRAEAVAKRASRGALSDGLLKVMPGLKANETYPVLLWLPTAENFAPKEQLVYDSAARASQAAEHELAQAAARSKLLAKAGWLKDRLRVVTGTPAVVVELTATEMMKLAPLTEIVEMLPFKPGKPASSTTYVDTIEASYGTTFLSGNGVDVCLVEVTNPDTSYSEHSNIGGFMCSTNSTNAADLTHARCSAAMVRSAASPYGSAKDAKEFWGSPAGCSGATKESGLRWCASNKIPVWNMGFASTAGFDALFDYMAKTAPWPLIVVPTSQNGTTATACPTACTNTPGSSASNGFNTLIVGGSRDCATSDRSDDMAYCEASTANPNNGDQEVPHLVAPAFDIVADAYNCAHGTSWASALTAGGATQLIEQDSSLAGWPEALRAILMTTANVSVDHVALNLSDSVDDRDGAGEVDIVLADRLADSSAKVDGGNAATELGRDNGSLNSGSTPAGSYYAEEYAIRTASSGKKVRIVLTWDGSGTCTNINDSNTCTSLGKDADLDLYLYDGSTVVASSSSAENTFEFIEYALAPNKTYTLKIQAYSWNSSSTYFGVAWFVGDYTNN